MCQLFLKPLGTLARNKIKMLERSDAFKKLLTSLGVASAFGKH